MVPDSQTNKLYLAGCLPVKHQKFFKEFESILSRCNIPCEKLQNTKDIWAVDYMPIQISTNNFIQFTYCPDYLNEYRDTISNVDSICKTINVKTVKSKLIVDSGNVVRSTDKVIMCDKVFHENSNISEKNLIKYLKDLFQVDKLFFVPWDTDDFTGHADGMVRFIDSDTVLINNNSKAKPEFQKSFRMSLHNAGFNWEELP